MTFYHHHSLKPYNTFGVDYKAQHFAVFQSAETLTQLLPQVTHPLFVLGGGSNILLTQDFSGTVLKNEIRGITVVDDCAEHKVVRVGGGEVWHDFVVWSIEQGLAGIENLSLIPGSVGAAPIQNIGAYGVELTSVFSRLEAVHVESGERRAFTHEQCQFGYRDSIFKRQLKNQYIITYVYFRLNKNPSFVTSYGAIQSELQSMGVTTLSLQAISQAVINIRQRKLPDPKVLGNSGSFFKNPIVPLSQFEQLKKQFPGIVGYSVDENQTKVAAGWLIDQAGWKGYRQGDAGIHQQHALVLVNHGKASGQELIALAREIQQSVRLRFGVVLETEVNIL